VVYGYCFIVTDVAQKIQSLLDEGYDTLNIIGYAMFFLIIVGFLMYFIALPVTNFFIQPKAPHDVAIVTDQEVYSPLISTTTGIELYPTNCTNLKSFYPNYNKTGFRWETNYGYFLTEDSYTQKRILLDNYTVRQSPNKVYWSYTEDDIPKDRSQVQIKLKIYNLEDGWNWTPRTNTSLNLTWTDQNYARVVDFTPSHSLEYWTMYHPWMISD
jgi:hypothetical protein